MSSTNDMGSVKIAIVGAGLMGHGIAHAFMVAGFSVAVWDPNRATLEDVPRRIEEHMRLMGEKGSVNVNLCPSLSVCVEGCDLVVEAAPEKLALKRDLIQAIDAVNRSCIVASNTSVLRITEIAAGSLDPTRVVGTHWWNPPYLMPLVEVVRGEQTSQEVARRVKAWLVQAGKVPVDVFRDIPGFVGNRMQFALVREAAYIVEQGICSAETVDLVASLTFGRRLAAVGPLRNSDFIGLDLVTAILDYLAPSLSDVKQAPQLFRERVEAGALGAKTGSGVYAWKDGDRQDTERLLLNHLLNVHRQEAEQRSELTGGVCS